MDQPQDIAVEVADDAVQLPRRVAYVRQGTSAQVRREAEPERFATAFPHLIVREILAFQVLVIVLAVVSLLFDAPLEWEANPDYTPNPAKAPWYFLGLQELLHYFPPVVAGVLIPALVVICLVLIPYFEINIKREGLWKADRRRTFVGLTAGVVVIGSATAALHAYPIAIPTLVVYGLTLVPLLGAREDGWVGWLAHRSLAEWIMTWFVLVAATLTTIGVFFRGPGWQWSWPWVAGIF
jgi:quinol-cytochrome oxidoreductase complex cytochrome b subunit